LIEHRMLMAYFPAIKELSRLPWLKTLAAILRTFTTCFLRSTSTLWTFSMKILNSASSFDYSLLVFCMSANTLGQIHSKP
jgi:hypothetical protein